MAEIREKRTLDSWTRNYNQEKKDIYPMINSLTSEAVASSLIGELTCVNSPHEKFDGKYWYEHFIRAARNYQKIFELLDGSSIELMQWNEKYTFLFMATFEFHNSMQHSCAISLAKKTHKALDELKEKTSIQTEDLEHFNLLLQYVILDFLECNLNFCKSRCASLISEIKQVLATCKTLSQVQILDLSCILYLTRSVNCLSDFLLLGTSEFAEKSAELLKFSKELASESGRPDLRYITNKLITSLLSLKKLSIWNLCSFLVLDSSEKRVFLTEYIKSKIETGFYLLYPSQYEALVSGILEKDAHNVLVSMPTGSGKTLLAELMVLASVLNSWTNRGLALYMVPSRALAKEKYDDFTAAFRTLKTQPLRVCQITGETIIDDKEAIEENDLVILTPEKLDMLIRSNYYNKDVNTLVVDEFHNIRTGFRGIRIQFDIVRHRKLFPRSKVVLISAIVSNFEEIIGWLKADKAFRTTWRPTFTRAGLYSIEPVSKTKIHYTDGISFTVMPREKECRRDAYKRYAANLAKQVAREGPVMIFSSSKQGVITFAEYLANEVGEKVDVTNPSEKERLQFKLKRIVGEEEAVYRFYAKGIGIHRGDLPHVIRRIIEEGVRKGALRYIISTTTLAEGINLPLKTIIIPKPEIAGEEMPLSLFFNLAGRAGRPRTEIEGQVIIMTSKNYPETELEQRYLEAKATRDVEKITTPLIHILELGQQIQKLESTAKVPDDFKKLERIRDDKKIHEAVLDSVLLALVIESKISTILNDEGLLNELLIRLEQDEKEDIVMVLKESQNRLIGYKVMDENQNVLSPTKFGGCVHRTGFSPKSCIDLLEELPSLETNLAYYSKPTFANKMHKIGSVLNLMVIPIETKAYFPNQLPSEYKSILMSWIQSIPLRKISKRYFKGHYVQTMLTVENLLAGFSSWFLYAFNVLAKHYFDQLEREVPHYFKLFHELPKQLWFGTEDRTALHIMEADVSRELLRDDVLLFTENEGMAGQIIRNPSLIDAPDAINYITSLNLQTDPIEFRDTLRRVLKIKEIVQRKE